MSLGRSTVVTLLQCLRRLFANSSLPPLLLLLLLKDKIEVLLLIQFNDNYCRSPLL
jgi:hypothetical protein